MLKAEESVLLVVDIQGKLAGLMHEKEALFANASKMIRGARVLDIPIVWLEQNPDGLGATVSQISEVMPEGLAPISKLSFSCCGEEKFMAALTAAGRRQVLLLGIEAHICVGQTAADLLAMKYEVHVLADAVSSRAALNKQVALERIKDAGGQVTSVEAALFEMLRVAEGPEFKEIVRIVK